MPADDSPLTCTKSWRLPLGEASALGFRYPARGDPELLSVDDEEVEIARAVVTAGDIRPATIATKVRRAFEKRGLPTRDSHFEGVAGDAAGRVFLVQEDDERIVVLSPDLRAVDRVIDLHVDPNEPDLGPDWHGPGRRNSRAEGLLLLRNGHILVAKQRERPWLIEFGPANNEARGVTVETILRRQEEFRLPVDRAVYHVLAKWRVPDGIQSLNDLALDGSGRVYVSSSASDSIGRVRGDLLPGEPVAFDSWRLPAAVRAGKAEGLAHWPGNGWLVAVDYDGTAPSSRHNLFLVTGVPM